MPCAILRLERTQIPVRYDPFDIGTTYAYCQGQWVQCLSQYYQQLHGHSEKELELATEELREQARRNHQAASITPLHLAEFLADVQAHQRVLLQRVRDLEQGAVVHALDAECGEKDGSARASGGRLHTTLPTSGFGNGSCF